MLDGNTLLFVLACGLFIAAWCAFFYGIGSAFSEAHGAPDTRADAISLIVSACLMIASGGLHWLAGTWGWFAWPWTVIALLLAFAIARARFVPAFRIGAPIVLVAVSAVLLLPIFI